MKLWIDAQLSPAIARWISDHFEIQAIAVRDLGLRDASDEEIFANARAAGAVVMSKDNDFVRLVEEHGIPPQLVWITCGNCSNNSLQKILSACLNTAIKMLRKGEAIVEIEEA